MTKMVLDASAATAVIRGEPGFEAVLPHLHGSLISTVNLAEVVCTAVGRGSTVERVHQAIRHMQLLPIGFDQELCDIVAEIYPLTRGSSVGLADRACMALGKRYDLPVLTSDHAWLDHDVGVEVQLFRQRKRK